MNRHVDVDRLFEEWLADGPSQLSDRAIESIVRQLDETPQRKHSWLPGREEMNRLVYASGAVALAAVVVAVIALNTYFDRPGVGDRPTPSPTAAPTPTAEPTAAPSPTAESSPTPAGLDEGEFLLYDGRRGGSLVEVTIPAPGWDGEAGVGILIKNGSPDAPDGAGLIGPFTGDDVFVYGDPCQWRTTIPDTPATTVDDMVAALRSQASRDASEPVDIMIDGHPGRLITLHVPDDAAFAQCDRGEFRTLVDDPVADSARFHQDPGQIDEVWIVDVDGELMVFFAAYYEGTPAKHVDEMRLILESMQFLL